MWLHRSPFIWFYISAFFVKSIYRNFQPCDALLVIVHLSLIHKVIGPYENRGRAFSALCRRTVCAAFISFPLEYVLLGAGFLASFLVAVMYTACVTSSVAEVSTKFSEVLDWIEAKADEILFNRTSDDQTQSVTSLLERTALVAAVFLPNGAGRTAVAWFLTKGYTQMAGDEQLLIEDVFIYTIAGWIGLGMGRMMFEWTSTLVIQAGWWYFLVGRPIMHLLWFALGLVRAGFMGVAVGGLRMLHKEELATSWLIGVGLTVGMNVIGVEFGWEKPPVWSCSGKCIPWLNLVGLGLGVLVLLGAANICNKKLNAFKREERERAIARNLMS